jgi:hypothetical protein
MTTPVLTFPIVPASRGTLVVPLAAATVTLAALVTVLLGPSELPAGARLGLGVALPVAVLLLLASAVGSQRARFEVRPEGLRLRGDVYGRGIPFASLRLGEARVLATGSEPAVRPQWRMVGTGLPGYRSGWFRMADGSRALLYLTDAPRVLHLPTADGYALVLSAHDPDALLAALRRTAGTSGSARR